MKKSIKKKEISKRDRYTIVLEDLNSKIGLLVDGQKMLDEKFDRFKTETEDNFQSIRGDLGSFKVETANNFAKTFKFQVETENNFKVVLEYLPRIDDELQTKIEQKQFVKLDERLSLVEKILIKQKMLKT